MGGVAVLRLFRAPMVLTAVADSATGYLLARGVQPVEGLTLALLAVASGGLFCFGMALNDIADRHRDLRGAPDRVLASGALTLQQARWAAGGALAGSLVALAGAAVRGGAAIPGLLTWTALVAFILAYDGPLKTPPVMGAVRAMNLALGIVVALPSGGQPQMLAFGIVPLLYGTALTFISTLEERPAPRAQVAAGALGLCASVALTAWVAERVAPAPSPAGWAAAGPLIAWIAWRGWGAGDGPGVKLLVRDGVGGIILLDASMLLFCGQPVAGAAVACLVLPTGVLVWTFKSLRSPAAHQRAP